MRRRRATVPLATPGEWAARSGEWAQHFSNASCFRIRIIHDYFPYALPKTGFLILLLLSTNKRTFSSYDRKL